MASTPETTDAVVPPGPGKAAVITAVVVLLIAGYIGIAMAVGIAAFYGGFLLLWYWASVEKLNFQAAPRVTLGALLGTGTSWVLQYATLGSQTALAIAVLLFIVLSLYIITLEILPLVFNPAYTLYLTVACAPALQENENFPDVLAALLLGVVYFGAIVWLIGRLTPQPAATD